MKQAQLIKWISNHFEELPEYRQEWIFDMVQGHLKEQAQKRQAEKRHKAFEQMDLEKLVAALKAEIQKTRPRGTWKKAVKDDALWLLDQLLEDNSFTPIEKPETAEALEEILLNGADVLIKDNYNKSFKSWINYSECGNALIYDEDIAKHYCNKTELKHYKNGLKEPHTIKGEDSWLKVQGRALYQANRIINKAFAIVRGSHWPITY